MIYLAIRILEEKAEEEAKMQEEQAKAAMAAEQTEQVAQTVAPVEQPANQTPVEATTEVAQQPA